MNKYEQAVYDTLIALGIDPIIDKEYLEKNGSQTRSRSSGTQRSRNCNDRRL